MHAAARSPWRRFAMLKMRFAAPKKKSVVPLKKLRARLPRLKKPSAALQRKLLLVSRKLPPLLRLRLRLKLQRPLLPRLAPKPHAFSRRLRPHGVPMARRRRPRRVRRREPLHLDLPVAVAANPTKTIAQHRVAALRRVAVSCVRNRQSPLPRARRATKAAVRAS